ncbi:MAG TPA: Rieske 2Fe-2S domain-containing protein [Candidatus Limnocylindria bacterium]|jgi:cytochrome b6-f complex iron-sulfur subunit|nr:Rieske 2Fe-2S domain-containing protein [Candidatus Limnocylindria bacterium]
MLRVGTRADVASRWQRRTLLRLGFIATLGLAAGEVAAMVAPFIRVNRIEGLGKPVVAGAKAQILERFAATNDRPILFREGRFFLLHAPGGIIAAYRKCTHLGCAVPWSEAEDRFHCPCHGSLYDKRTAVVLRTPAPRPLQLFHITEDAAGTLVVDTNPLRLIDRAGGAWDPSVIEVTDS